HQVDAAARRLGLQPRDSKGRTRIEAQAAVNARREVVVGQPRKWRGHTTYLAGFRTWSGSKASLSRRMTSIVGGVLPHAPTSLVKSSVAVSMTSLPPAASALALIAMI